MVRHPPDPMSHRGLSSLWGPGPRSQGWKEGTGGCWGGISPKVGQGEKGARLWSEQWGYCVQVIPSWQAREGHRTPPHTRLSMLMVLGTDQVSSKPRRGWVFGSKTPGQIGGLGACMGPTLRASGTPGQEVELAPDGQWSFCSSLDIGISSLSKEMAVERFMH